MQNKKIYLWVVVVIIIVAGYYLYSKKTPTEQEPTVDEAGNTSETTQTSGSTSKTGSKTTTKTIGALIAETKNATNTKLPDLDFINTRTVVNLKSYNNVKITIEKVSFGRGEIVNSNGCSKPLDANFTTYFYPQGTVCIGDANVDGAPHGLVSLLILVENGGYLGFGGTDLFKLHYLRADQAGIAKDKFAFPLLSMSNYYLQPYTAKEIVLTYVVPEDQLSYDFLVNYTVPITGVNKDVYQYSDQGLFIDFKAKTIAVVK